MKKFLKRNGKYLHPNGHWEETMIGALEITYEQGMEYVNSFPEDGYEIIYHFESDTTYNFAIPMKGYGLRS